MNFSVDSIVSLKTEVMLKEINLNIHEFGVFFYTLKAFGLASYSFCQKTSKIKVKLKDYLILIVSLLLTPYFIMLHSFDDEIYESAVQSKFVDELWRWDFMIQSYSIPFLILFNFFKRNRVGNFIRHIKTFDDSVKNMNWREKPTKSQRFNIFMGFLLITFGCLLLWYNYFAIFLSTFKTDLDALLKIQKITIYQLITQFHLVISLQFIFSVQCVSERLEILLKNIR